MKGAEACRRTASRLPALFRPRDYSNRRVQRGGVHLRGEARCIAYRPLPPLPRWPARLRGRGVRELRNKVPAVWRQG
jgi:hypothetical protein